MATSKRQSAALLNLQEEEFHPRSPLGRELWKIRRRVIASGEPLLDWEGLEREIAERRGGSASSH